MDRARARQLCSFAVTFDPHPDQVLFPERRHMYLSTAEERGELLKASGIDAVWICPFTRDLARLEPEEFIHMVSERQPIAELWVGADFAMGRNRKGQSTCWPSWVPRLAGTCTWSPHRCSKVRWSAAPRSARCWPPVRCAAPPTCSVAATACPGDRG